LLDNCLTTELLGRVYSNEKVQEEKRLSPSEVHSRHRIVRVDLTNMAGHDVIELLKRSLTQEELTLLCRRVDQFMIARGFSINGF